MVIVSSAHGIMSWLLICTGLLGLGDVIDGLCESQAADSRRPVAEGVLGPDTSLNDVGEGQEVRGVEHAPDSLTVDRRQDGVDLVLESLDPVVGHARSYQGRIAVITSTGYIRRNSSSSWRTSSLTHFGTAA